AVADGLDHIQLLEALLQHAGDAVVVFGVENSFPAGDRVHAASARMPNFATARPCARRRNTAQTQRCLSAPARTPAILALRRRISASVTLRERFPRGPHAIRGRVTLATPGSGLRAPDSDARWSARRSDTPPAPAENARPGRRPRRA